MERGAAVALALALALAPAAGSRAAAAAAAADVAAALPAAALADDPPVAAVRAGPVTVLHAAGDAGYARAVAAIAAAAHERIRRDFVLEHEVEVAILLLTPNSPERTREAWAERLPHWMAGAAIQAEQFVVIRVRPGETPSALGPVIAHELAHVILKADFRGSDGWPLWFREGLAMRQERGEAVRDYVALSAAALFRRVIPLDLLAVRFPRDEAGARLAYAESMSFLGFLDQRFGRLAGRILMRELRQRNFDDAFRTAYGMGPAAAEGLWQRWANRRYAWIPAVTSGTTLWVLITLLFLVAIPARRRRSRLMRERWEAEEREDGLDS